MGLRLLSGMLDRQVRLQREKCSAGKRRPLARAGDTAHVEPIASNQQSPAAVNAKVRERTHACGFTTNG